MCRKQKAMGAILIAGGVGLLLCLVMNSAAASFLIASALILAGVFLLVR